MFVVTRSPKIALLSLAVSRDLLILYFTVIKSDQNTANNAIRRASSRLSGVARPPRAAGPAGVTNLVNCLAAAGANTSDPGLPGEVQAVADPHGADQVSTFDRNDLVRASRGLPSTSAGLPDSTTTPSSMNTTESATSRANPISCVTTIIVIPSRAS